MGFRRAVLNLDAKRRPTTPVVAVAMQGLQRQSVYREERRAVADDAQ